jgi:hypothetical protein
MYPYLDIKPYYFSSLSPDVYYSPVVVHALDWISNIHRVVNQFSSLKKYTHS